MTELPISFDDAFAQTNPSMTDEQRKSAAAVIVAGTAAADAYWDSRGTLERLQAQADGHGVVQRGQDTVAPVSVSTTESAPVIDSTATEDDTADKLREQLKAAGLTPEA